MLAQITQAPSEFTGQITSILGLVNLYYVAIVILTTRVLFRYVLVLGKPHQKTKPKLRAFKLLCTTGVGMVYGVVGYILHVKLGYTQPVAFTSGTHFLVSTSFSFLLAIYLYDAILKLILSFMEKKLGVNPENTTNEPPSTDPGQ